MLTIVVGGLLIMQITWWIYENTTVTPPTGIVFGISDIHLNKKKRLLVFKTALFMLLI